MARKTTKQTIDTKINESKIIKPIKEVITSKTEVKLEAESKPKVLKLKQNEDIKVLKKYQKELDIDHFETEDGRWF